MSARWKWVVIGVPVWLALGWLGAPDARGQKEEAGTTADKLYFGVKACSNPACHSSPPPSPPTKAELICRCVEAKEWEAKDKHDQAYLALTGERGKRMGALLGRDVTKEKACLACHAVWIDPKDQDKKHDSFKIEEGVNCVACHGAYANWVDAHAGLRAARFRPLSRGEKWTTAGMRDLWDPLKRAELCASCHVGNAAEGKVLTHEMYAAGHPPLPAFEPATYSNEMPRHWQYLREKSPGLQKELGLKPGELEETKLLLVGAAVSLRDAMRLIQADAASDGVKNGDALDLAHFDCYACHHELKADSWRLRRGPEKGRKPGRVGVRPWSTELVRLAIAADDKADERLAEYEKRLAALNAAFDARPYGEPAAVAQAAKGLEAFADGLATALNGRTFTAADAKRLASAVPKVFRPTEKLYDYDSARQIVWGYEVLRKELVRAAKPGEDGPEVKAIDDELKGLNAVLGLRLPRKIDGKVLGPEYPATMKRLAEYDPLRARGLFGALR